MTLCHQILVGCWHFTEAVKEWQLQLETDWMCGVRGLLRWRSPAGGWGQVDGRMDSHAWEFMRWSRTEPTTSEMWVGGNPWRRSEGVRRSSWTSEKEWPREHGAMETKRGQKVGKEDWAALARLPLLHLVTSIPCISNENRGNKSTKLRRRKKIRIARKVCSCGNQDKETIERETQSPKCWTPQLGCRHHSLQFSGSWTKLRPRIPVRSHFAFLKGKRERKERKHTSP